MGATQIAPVRMLAQMSWDQRGIRAAAMPPPAMLLAPFSPLDWEDLTENKRAAMLLQLVLGPDSRIQKHLRPSQEHPAAGQLHAQITTQPGHAATGPSDVEACPELTSTAGRSSAGRTGGKCCGVERPAQRCLRHPPALASCSGTVAEQSLRSSDQAESV